MYSVEPTVQAPRPETIIIGRDSYFDQVQALNWKLPRTSNLELNRAVEANSQHLYFSLEKCGSDYTTTERDGDEVIEFTTSIRTELWDSPDLWESFLFLILKIFFCSFSSQRMFMSRQTEGCYCRDNPSHKTIFPYLSHTRLWLTRK